MHQTRRKKKRPVMANLKTVEVARGRNGYGFTLSGQSPCILSCILSGSPAEQAGLKTGDYVMAVNGENVAKLSHEQVVKLIGVSTAVLRLTIAEKQRRDHTDSSDDEFVVNRPRPRSHPRMKTRTPPTPTNDYQNPGASRVDKVVEDLFRRTLFGNAMTSEAVEEHDEEENEKSDRDARLAPGHLSPFNKSGKYEVFLKKPQKLYERKVWTGKGFDDETGAKPRKTKQKYSERHQMSKQQMQYIYQQQQQQQQQQLHQQQLLHQQHMQQQYDSGRFMSTPDPAMINRPLSPLEVSSILYPSLQPHVSAAVPLDIDHELDEDDLYLRVVVGYLGSIEIPAEANLQTASLQAIRGCVRRLRIEQRIHTLVLMEITIRDVRLITSNGAVVVVYPAEKLAFTGVCPDDKRFFGLVTMHGLEDLHEMNDIDKDNFGSSCHVFMVDPEICSHSVHAKKAAKFGIQCAVDPETNGCREFPRSAKPILRTLAKLYQDRHNGLYVNELQRAQVYMGGDYPLDARRSNSNSSNSDSGIGYCRDSEGMNGSGSGDRVVVVDIPKNGHEYYNGQSAATPNRLVVKADVMHNSDREVAYSLSSSSAKSQLSSDHTHKNTTAAVADASSRLCPRVRAHPQEPDRPVSRLGMHVYTDSVDSGSTQESLNRAHQSSENEFTDEQQAIARAPTGLPPSGIHRHSMYAKVDNSGNRKDAAESNGIDSRRISDGRILTKKPDARNGTGRGSLRRGGKNKVTTGLAKSLSKESLATSDGDLHLQMVPVSRSSSLRSVDSTKDLQKEDVGRVASWAVSFERLLNDPMGLLYFTEFLKKEFSEENIAFWIACENFKKIKDPVERQRTARDMYNKHLGKKAGMPVNLDSHAKQEVEIRLENPTPDMFDFQQKQIFQLMKFDSYSRFLKSVLYRDCVMAELEGRPLPVQAEPADSTDTGSSTREVKINKKASKKEDKKKKDKEKAKKGKDLSFSGESETTDENAGEKRRKSLLPWNRNKSTKKPNKAEKKDKKAPASVAMTPAASSSSIEEKERKVNTREGSVGSTGSRRSSLASGDLNRFAKETSEGSESHERIVESNEIKEPHKFCRVILPDNSTTVIYARKGQSIRAALKLLCERRRIAIASLEVYDIKTNQMYGLGDDLSTLASKEIQVENRVMFKVELPNERVIGVKSKPNKAIIDVLNPIMSKYSLTLDGMVVHLSASPVQLELDIEVATLEGQRVIIESYEKYTERMSMGRPPLPPSGRLRKAESVDSTLDQSSQSNVHVVDMRPAKSEERLHDAGKAPAFGGSNSTLSKFIRTGAHRDEAAAGLQQKHGAARTGKAKTSRPTNTDKKSSTVHAKRVSSLRGVNDRGTVRSNARLNYTQAKDLFDLVAHAQHDRMDDQRGTSANFELPEFLKVQAARNGAAGGNKLKRSPPVHKEKTMSQWSSKSASDSENVDDVHGRGSEAERVAMYYPPPRPHSTPPIRQLQTMDLSLQDGVLPTHHEADFVFGSRGGRLTPEFNDSGLLGSSYREQNPPMEVSFLNDDSRHSARPALTKSKSLSRNRDDLSRLSPAVFSREHSHNHRSSPVVRFNMDVADGGPNTTVVESTDVEKSDALDIDDLDATITASEIPMPSPPTPKDVDTTYDFGEANYSPPPPLTSQERAALTARTANAGGAVRNPPPVPPKPTLKGKTQKGVTDAQPEKRPDNLVLKSKDTEQGASNLSSTDISTSPVPSPSTHDLFFTPSPEEGQGERDKMAAGSQVTPLTTTSKLDDDRSLGRSIMGEQYSILKNRQSRSRSGISVPSDSNNVIQLGKDADKLRITFV